MTSSPNFWLCVAKLSMHTDPLGPLGGEVTGGMNVYVREVARVLPSLGIHVDVFTRASDTHSPALVEIAPGARLIRIPAGPRRPLHKDRLLPLTENFAAGIRAFAKAQGGHYELISSHYWLSSVVGERLARAWDVPLALRFHTVAAQKNRALPTARGRESDGRILAETGLARRAEALLASSPAEARLLAATLGAKESRIHVVPCGVDLERFVPLPRAAARAALGLGQETPLILSVGRIEPIKGLDRLVEALAALKARRPDLPPRAIHVGGAIRPGNRLSNGCGHCPEDFSSPRQRAEVRRLLRRAKEAGVARHLCFAGAKPQEELPVYYSAADALAIPSRYESFGLVTLEAAACGLPAVAFDVGGLSHAIEAGGSGFLVPDGDAGAFADALLRLVEAPATRARLSRRARERARVFPWSAVASKETQIWRQLLHQRGRPREGLLKVACAGGGAVRVGPPSGWPLGEPVA